MARQFDRPTAGNMATPAQLVRYFDKFLTALEGVTADLQDQITAIAAAQAAADAAQTAADAAAADAATAQTTATSAATDAAAAQPTADAVTLTDRIGGSAVIPDEVLTATDAGTDATITIAANARLYNDGTTLTGIAGGSITGLAYSTTYGVYYDDPTASTTTPTYHATTTLSNALNNFVSGRHFVGNVTTPASGGAAVSGGYQPPGSSSDYKGKFTSV